MKKSRFTDSQIMAILKQHEAGVPVAKLAREHKVSTALLEEYPHPGCGRPLDLYPKERLKMGRL